jgi:pectate lyase
MRINHVRVRRDSLTAAAFITAVTLAALTWSLAASAQTQTLFSDNFEDGDAKGWSKSGGTWAVVADGSQVVNLQIFY